MTTSYRVIAAHELDAGLVAAWRSIQEREPRFESPYFCPEFTQAVGTVRDDVRVVVIDAAIEVLLEGGTEDRAFLDRKYRGGE